MKRIWTLLAFLLASPATAGLTTPRTEVLVVGSLHRLHASDPNFSFDRLYSLVADFRPDVVGVEIRPEDIKADSTYLAKSYPPEMIGLRDRYVGQIVGFDWLGPELAGKPIPADWWSHGSRVKALERAMSSDPSTSDAESERISDREAKILEAPSPSSVTDGSYYRLVRQKHAWWSEHLAKGPYADWVRFNDARDRHIDANIVKIVRTNWGRRIVFVMGADHHGYAVDALKAAFGSRIDIVLPK